MVERFWTKRGATLAELIITLGLFAVMMISLAYVTKRGFDFYWESKGSLDIQKAALVATRQMSRELSQSSMVSVEVFDGAAPATPDDPGPFDSLLFVVPEDANGVRHYTRRGQFEWQSYVAYMTDDVKGQKALVRYQLPVASPDIQVPVPADMPITPVDMAAAPSPKLVVTGVRALDFERQEDSVIVTFTSSLEEHGLFSITIRNQMVPKN